MTDEMHTLEVEDILDQSSDEAYTDDSDYDSDCDPSDLGERDINSIMTYVFGDSDEEDTV